MSGPQPTIAQLRPALQFALDTARSGGGVLPGRVRSLVRARRLPPNWASTMRQILDEDGGYRQAVAADASSEELGRLAWLWLARPDGWTVEIGDLVRQAAEQDEKEQARLHAEQKVADLEREISAVIAARDEAVEEADKARRSASEQRRRAQEMSGLVDKQVFRIDELQAALADFQQRAASVDQLRRDLLNAQSARSTAEAALRDSEYRAERAELEARNAQERHTSDRIEADRARSELTGSVAAAVGRAAEASEALGAALREAASLLGFVPETGKTETLQVAGSPPAGSDRRRRTAAKPERTALRLPPAVLDEAPEAAAYLVRAAGAHLVVDGYNVTFRSWSGEDLPSLRHRLVSALSELSLRYRLPVTVVFDGADAGGLVAPPPAARMLLRIVFSASEVEADAVIVDTVRSLPSRTPVIVATDDREVRHATRGLGANVLSVEQLLGVIERQAGGRGR